MVQSFISVPFFYILHNFKKIIQLLLAALSMHYTLHQTIPDYLYSGIVLFQAQYYPPNSDNHQTPPDEVQVLNRPVLKCILNPQHLVRCYGFHHFQILLARSLHFLFLHLSYENIGYAVSSSDMRPWDQLPIGYNLQDQIPL